MDLGLLGKIFGSDSSWHGPCLVLLDAEAAIHSTGPDTILGGGNKQYAPRVASSRVTVDAICFVPEHHALLLMQRQISRRPTGDDDVQETLLIVDTNHVIGLQFNDTALLDVLGVPYPILPEKKMYAPGTLVG